MIVFLQNIISFIIKEVFSEEGFYPFILKRIFKSNNKNNFYLDLMS